MLIVGERLLCVYLTRSTDIRGNVANGIGRRTIEGKKEDTATVQRYGE